MLRPVKVKALPDYRLWLEYSDGVCGEVDLSDKLGHDYYREWKEEGVFEKARIEYFDTILWNDGLGVNPYELYMEITGKPYDELPAEVQDYVVPPGNDWTLKAVEVKPLPGYRIWVEFNDGVSGEIDLSEHVGKPVFRAWDEPGFFEKVRITSYGAVMWNDDLELCSDALYMEITGKSWEELVDYVTSASTCLGPHA